MAMNWFSLNGVKSISYGVIISGAGAYGAPARSYEAVSVPGKNGDVFFDNGRYENIIVPYEAGVMSAGNVDAFRAWLLSHTDYCRIEDSYHPMEYRIGKPVNGLIPDMQVMLKMGKFTVSFNCKPQRFLKTGEDPVTLPSSGSMNNTTLFTAKPLIRVRGSGTLRIGSETVTIASNALSYIDLDCETQDAFCGGTNANGYVTLSGDSYPTLKPGTNYVSYVGFSSVVITPRWWTL